MTCSARAGTQPPLDRFKQGAARSSATTSACGYGSLLSQGRRFSSPRHVRRHREPAAVLPRPDVGVAAGGLLAVRRGVARGRVDDGEIAHQANPDVVGFEISNRQGHGGLLEKAGAVDQRLVGIGATEVFGEDFVEAYDVRVLDGIDVVAIEGGQFGEVVSHGLLPLVIPGSANGSRERAPDDRLRANYDVQLHIGESPGNNFWIPGSSRCDAPE